MARGIRTYVHEFAPAFGHAHPPIALILIALPWLGVMRMARVRARACGVAAALFKIWSFFLKWLARDAECSFVLQ